MLDILNIMNAGIIYDYTECSFGDSYGRYRDPYGRYVNIPQDNGITGSSNISVFNPESTFSRLKRPDFLIVYISLLILTILYIVVVFVGETRAWYRTLKQANINPWLIRGLWLLGTIMSYIAFVWISQDIQTHEIPRDLIVSVLFVITDFLFLAWSIAFYHAQDISLSFWVAIIIYIYNLWLTIYVWKISPFAALFLVPNLILYIYLIYSTIHLASLNRVPM